jgi:hypothetical protein
VLEEFVGLNQAFEFLDVDEVLVATGDLGRALLARGVGHRNSQEGIAIEHGFHQGGLAGARWRGDDE